MQRALGETRATSQSWDAPNGFDGHHANHINASSQPLTFELDALVVGAGFSGCYLLHLLRNEGFSVKLIEAGTGLGGIWHWNSYPGARVDSQYPIYQYSLPEVYKDWKWSEAYPSSAELRAYFQHVDKQLNLSKDVIFSSKVIAAQFDESQDKWLIICDTGMRITARFFLPCTGFAAKRHFPSWPGLDSFAGTICHSSFWPESGLDVSGKRVAIIGTGATGIQIAQETARTTSQLTVFQRTPNLCCPMCQTLITPEQAVADLKDMPATMAKRYTTFAGFLYQPQRDKKTFDHSPQERRTFFQALWDMGGFRMLANNYGDMLSNPAANREAYDFWAEKTRERISDPIKREVLAPLEPVHYFGGKRLSLEQDFYEQMNKSHVEVINIRANPVTHVTEKGIVTQDGVEREFDVIAVATGFDSFTGGLKDMNIQGLGGKKLNEKWEMGTWTAFGITVSGFPNFFFLYGPQAPTAYANGPSITEPQARWVRDVMVRMRGARNEYTNGGHNDNTNNNTNIDGKDSDTTQSSSNGTSQTKPSAFHHTRINATPEAEQAWRAQVIELHKGTLRNEVDSWYMGANVPGKPREPLNYAGGIPEYMRQLQEAVFEEGSSGGGGGSSGGGGGSSGGGGGSSGGGGGSSGVESGGVKWRGFDVQ